nr:hypothetical protein [Ilumatobacter coccineus]
MVDSVDLNTARVVFRRGTPASRRRSGGSGKAPILDGTAALATFCERAGYPSIEAAVAEQTVFLDPITVAQTHGGALFPVVRDQARRGQDATLPDGRRVVCCDNATPTRAFLWAADRINGSDTQFNHVWNTSNDPDAYTALWNLCCTPAFLAKATDTHDGVKAMLRYRAFDLFGFVPAGVEAPDVPDGYESLVWGAPPPATDQLEARLRRRLAASPKSRAAHAARTIGWLFSDGPDSSLIAPA